jgi:methionyl-tRNA synthetase
MEIADFANQYVDENKPWILAKDESKLAELHDVCTTALILFRQLSILLSPVLPGVAANVAKFLNDRSSTGRRPMWPAAWSPTPCWAAPSAPTRT